MVSLWLKRAGRPVIYTFLPMILVSTATLLAMLGEVRGHVGAGNWLLASTASLILVLDIWIMMEGLTAFFGRHRRKKPSGDPEPVT